MKFFYLLILLLVVPVFIYAGILKGKVIDKKGEVLSFATVFVQGTTIGTSANGAGEYQLTLKAGSYSISSQYIGYKQSSFSVKIMGDETVLHDFILEDQSLEMKEHIVKASEDPALYIMRKVIAKRSFHLKQISAFQTDIYLKGIFKTRQIPNKFLGEKVEPGDMGLDSNGKGILYLCEENATYYSQENKQRTVIHSVRESGDPNGFGFSTFPSVISFYKNTIDIAERISPRGFISPLNDLALNYYNYKLEGDFKEGKHTIYKISVSPKRLFEPLFTGHIYIVDDEWALHSIHLTATKKSNMELIDTLQIQQIYLPMKNNVWVIKQQVLYPTIKIFGFDFTGNFVTVYNNQKINEPVPDTIFENKVVSIYDPTANKKDSSYWVSNRPVPLDDEEVKDYIIKDSLRLVYEGPAYIDSMRKRSNRIKPMEIILTGITYRGKEDKYFFRTNSLLTDLVNFNTIEGLNVAPKFYYSYKIDSFHAINGKIAPRYGFENQHFNAIGRIAFTERSRTWISRSWTAGIEAGKYVFQFNPNNPLSGIFNSYTTLFNRENHLKLYERWDGEVFFEQNTGTGFKWYGELGFQQRIPVQNTTEYSFAKSDEGGFTSNIPEEYRTFKWEKHNAFIGKLSVSYQPGFTYTKYPDFMMPHRSSDPVFSLSYEKGFPNIFQSKVNYDKWRFQITDEMGLKLLGDLSYNIATGGFLNSKYLSIPDQNHLNGNQMIVAMPYLKSFQLAPYYLYSNKEALYGEAHIEWSLKGFLTNKIPLLRQLRWYLVSGTNTYYVNPNLYHIEAYFGIDNLGYDKFRILRVDYVWGWNSFNQKLGAIRLGFTSGGLLRVRAGDDSSEW